MRPVPVRPSVVRVVLRDEPLCRPCRRVGSYRRASTALSATGEPGDLLAFPCCAAHAEFPTAGRITLLETTTDADSQRAA